MTLENVPAEAEAGAESGDVWGEHARRLGFLGRVPLFAGVPARLLANVATAMRHAPVSTGGVVCREGEAADQFFMIESGTLVVTTELGGRPRELTRMGPGEFFGEIALLSDARRTATVTAATAASVWSLSAGDFRELLSRVPELEATVREAARVRESRSEAATFEVQHRNLAALLHGRSELRIGRATDNGLRFDSPTVANHHAVIRGSAGEFRIEDLSGGGGTLVNGASVKGSVALRDGDEVWIGDQRFFFDRNEIQQVREPFGMRIDAVGITKTVRKGKQILQHVSLSILPGEFVAIVGGSGAGKTTLMDALSGIRPPSTGQVLYNGRDFGANQGYLRNVLGYVPQDDIIHTELPLRMTLRHAAKLRLPPDMTSEQFETTLDEVLAQLSLTEQADQRVDSLSGGQRKRGSIAVELLTHPRVFFLDEPTSGLDPATDAQMMRLLRSLSSKGTTVVLTTHATKNVMLCDKIVFLARGGHLAFFGTPQRALQYFDAEAFDEIYEQLAERATPEEWSARFRASEDYRQLVAAQAAPGGEAGTSTAEPMGAVKRQGIGRSVRQFGVLLRRNVDLYLKNPPELMPMIMQPVFMSLLLIALFRSGLFEPDAGNPAAPMQLLFIFTFVCYLFGLLFGIQQIVKEYAIFRRERMVGLGIVPYVLSKVAFLLPILLYACALMMVILRVTNRLPDDPGDYAPLLLTLLLGALTGLSFALFTSAAVRSAQMANDLLSVWIMPQVLFAGALFAVPSMAAVGRFISTVAMLRWSFEASGQITGLPALFAADDSPIGPALALQYGDSFSRDPIQNWLIISVFIVVPLIATCLVLKKKTASR